MSENDGTALAPGYKTSEFWITLVLSVAGVAAGIGLPEENVVARVAAFILALGATLGYQVIRGSVKRAQLENS